MSNDTSKEYVYKDFINNLKMIRDSIADRSLDNLDKTIKMIEKAKAAEKILKGGEFTEPGTSEISSGHHFLELVEHKYLPYLKGPHNTIEKVVAFLIFDPSDQQVLLTERGSYKRLFPGKFTTVVSHHEKDDKTSFCDLIKKEFSQQKQIQEQIQGCFDTNDNKYNKLVAKSLTGFLYSSEFHSVTNHEFKKLSDLIPAIESAITSEQDVYVDLSPTKRSLYLYTICQQSVDRIECLKVAIQQAVGIKPFVEQSQKSFEVYLTHIPTDKMSDLAEALEKLHHPQPEDDKWCWRHFIDVEIEFNKNPSRFAIDIMQPVLGLFRDPTIRSKIKLETPRVLDQDNSLASCVSIVGGKAENLHYMRTINPVTGSGVYWIVPRGLVITTFAFDEHVLQYSQLHERIQALHEMLTRYLEPGEEALKERLTSRIRELLESIRTCISTMDLRSSFTRELEDMMESLGPGPFAVRSSATCEDSSLRAGAGMGESFLNVDHKLVTQCLRNVWASLYSDSFFLNKLLNAQARMAVIIQPMVNVEAAGVMMTVDPSNNRPGFFVEAMVGLGEQVVEAKGVADRWFISPDAQHILEADSPSGRGECLREDQLLQLAKIGRDLLESYRTAKRAFELDFEFAFDRIGHCYLLQARPLTTVAAAKTKRIRVVDEDHQDVKEAKVKMTSGLTANPGVAYGKLQIIGPQEDFNCVESNRIVVAQNTNNAWNGVFPRISGLITEGGNLTSHAATNSRECGIPAIVAFTDALKKLTEWNNRDVTLDSRNGKLYLGNMPTKEIDQLIAIWLSEIEEKKSDQEKKTVRELLDNLGNTVESKVGPWLGKPKIQYKPLQLDYYWRAWDRLPDILHQIFPEKPCINGPLRRAIIDKVLYFPITSRPANQHPLYALMDDLSLNDLSKLMLVRREILRRADHFFSSLDRISAGNVQAISDRLIDVMACLHLAFYYHHFLHANHLDIQTKYINDGFYGDIEEAAVALDRSLLPGDMVYLTRQKNIDVWEIAERIHLSNKLRELFTKKTPILEEVEKIDQETAGKIGRLSRKYKQTDEAITRLDDQESFLKDLHDRISIFSSKESTNQASGANLDRTGDIKLIVLSCESFLHLNSTPSGSSATEAVFEIAVRNPKLAAAIRFQANSKNKQIAEIIDEIRQRLLQRQCIENQIKKYARLCKVLSLSVQEQYIREDGHHWITRWQRRIAPMVFRWGERACNWGILGTKEDVFNLHLNELVALVKYERESADYIKQVKGREEKFAEAGKVLGVQQVDKNEPRPTTCENYDDVCREYEKQMELVFDILKNQRQAADNNGHHEVAEYYQSEVNRLKTMVEWISQRKSDNHQKVSSLDEVMI